MDGTNGRRQPPRLCLECSVQLLQRTQQEVLKMLGEQEEKQAPFAAYVGP